MRPNVVRTMALAASVAFAACGETDLPLDELNEAEAQELAAALVVQTFTTAEAGQPEAPATAGAQLAPFSYDGSVETSVQCPLGGVVALAADVAVEGDTESEAVALDYSMTQVHDACGVVTDSERQFTLWGAPSLMLDLLVESNGQGVVEMAGSVVGGVDWATDDREGHCEVALEMEARIEAEVSVDYGMSGTVCDFEVSSSLVVG
ncbi:MAG: hypothetical protein PVJ80_03410 [Gemmatimonadota bacterium]